MEWPKTVEEAVQRLVIELPEQSRTRISAMAEERDLYAVHHFLGRAIRNIMGLWQANYELLADCMRVALANGQNLTPLPNDSPFLIHPDDASHAILVELWKKLHEPVPEFKRELKYEVTKLADIDKYLTYEEDLTLIGLIRKIQDGRVADGKVRCNDYVVVNEQEDYAEQVWALIEDGERRKQAEDELDICECGDYRRQHENGTGKCRMPDDMCHGLQPCESFRLAPR